MGARHLRAVETASGRVLGERIEEARSPFRRLRGLLGRARLDAGEGLLLTPCNGVHTVGMRFAIDVVFLDGEDRVVRVTPSLSPGRAIPWVRRSHRALELPAGSTALAGVVVGTRLRIEPVDRGAIG